MLIHIIEKAYTYSIPFVFILFWFWISNIDKIHVRERMRLLGNKIETNEIFKKYIFLQMNILFEGLTGLTDGLIKTYPIVKPSFFKTIELQTDDIEPTIIEKEIIVEVPIEVIKEVEVIKEIEVIKEVEVPIEIPIEVIREVIREIEVPVEIIKEVIKEIPREVIKEIYVDKNSDEHLDTNYNSKKRRIKIKKLT